MEYYAVSTSNALQHHGVLGQKWGVRRYQNADGTLTLAGKHRAAEIHSYDKKNERLAYKVERKERRAARLERKAEQIHAKKDLGASNRAARKSANYELKAAKLNKKAIGEEDEYKRLKIEAKAAKKQFKSDKYKAKADKLSKLAGYSARAMHYAIKSDKVKAQASKARMKIANNKKMQAFMQKSISEIPSKAEMEKKLDSYYNNSSIGKKMPASMSRHAREVLYATDNTYRKMQDDYMKNYG